MRMDRKQAAEDRAQDRKRAEENHAASMKRGEESEERSIYRDKLLQKQIVSVKNKVDKNTDNIAKIEKRENEHYNELTRSMKKQERAINRAGIRCK
jgi:hypothetical protein